MESEQWTPDIVVGIDFGMTCTGVAYSTGPDWHDPKVIQIWPGLAGQELRNKVTSALSYEPRTRNVVSWGFTTDLEADCGDTHDLFKLYLDPSFNGGNEERLPAAQARACFRDYLQCVRKYVEQTFEESDAHFDERNIEYIFSTPTTWTNPGMIDQIDKTLREAGFEDTHNRRSRIGLTEAEAAAVYASKHNHRKGEVILVCDAGGGTTDLNALKVDSTARRQTGLNQLVFVEGQAIGSALIDYRVRKLLIQRLNAIHAHLGREPEECASIMMRGRFENYKCSFGATGSNAPSLPMPIPNLSPGFNAPEVGITDSKLRLRRDELKDVFDEQVGKIAKLVESQLSVLQQEHPMEHIDYFVLSGGLGSSPYVKEQLKNRCEGDIADAFPCAKDMKFLTVQNPQTAVVLGLVSDRVQELDSGIRVFKDRCARNSYGVLCRELYNPLDHMGEQVIKDPRDKKKWAEGQIHWLIKKGQTVSTERHLQQKYMLKVNLGQEDKPWRTDIVMSDRPKDELPRSLNRPGAWILCNIQSSLDPDHLKRKNKRWYSLGKEYNHAEFILKVLIGASDLKFQLWNMDGERISRDHKDIQVRWDPPQANAETVDMQSDAGVYRI